MKKSTVKQDQAKSYETVLVTGAAGFIGFHTAKALLLRGDHVISIDNLNSYYDVNLKESRVKILEEFPHFKLYRGDIEDIALIRQIFKENRIDKVCHLAAQAGVRYSITNPHTYISSNVVGFVNLLDETKNAGIKTFVYSSSSSVYGNQKKIPFSTSDDVNRPISLYAATKKSNELFAYTYHHLFGLHCTGLRFFTAYGPWGRPDMAYFKFAEAISKGKSIDVYNHGKMKRDFTYIDDIVAGILSALDKSYGYEIFNLGNNKPVTLSYFVRTLEKALGKKAKINYLPLQPGDVLQTHADIEDSAKKLGFRPKVSLTDGMDRFADWFFEYNNN